MRWPWQRNTNHGHGSVGIAMHKSGAMAAVAMQNNLVVSMLSLDHIDWSHLGQWVKQLGWKRFQSTLVLPYQDYQLQMLPAPDVEDHELADAMRFRLGELTTTPLEKLQVQAFRLPPDAYRGRQSMAFVAFAEQSAVFQQVQGCREQDLRLEHITIGEMALLDLVAEVEPEASIALLQLDDTSGKTLLYSNGALYLRRDFNVGYQTVASELETLNPKAATESEPVSVSVPSHDGMGSSDEQPDGIVEGITAGELTLSDDFALNKPLVNHPELDRLTLEIQRSLDYFDSQLAMGVVGQLWLVTSGSPLEDSLLEALEQQLNLPCRRFSLRTWLNDTESDWNHATSCALGAALGISHEVVGESEDIS